MLLLTFLLPALLVYFTDPSYGGRLKGTILREVPIPPDQQLQPQRPGGVGGPPDPQPGPPPGQPGQPRPPGGGQPPPAPELGPGPVTRLAEINASEGEYVTYHIDRFVKRHLPDIPQVRHSAADAINGAGRFLGLVPADDEGPTQGDKTNQSSGGFMALKPLDRNKSVVAGLVGGTYQFLCNMEEVKPAFSLFVGMSVLTLLCWVIHWRRRGYSTKRLDLTPAAVAAPPRPLDAASLEAMPVD
jgi:hypothetical protein